MNILIVGSGAREHALAWKLSLSPRQPRLFMAPGNGGTATLGVNLDVAAEDLPGVAAAVKRHKIDLVVVGPEGPLALGIVDHLQALGVPVFGPSRQAAAIEASKAFAKEVMRAAGIPTASSRSFTSFEAARAYVQALTAPPVVKADGLAAGKGVMVAESIAEAVRAIEDSMVNGAFGEAGRTVVVEERLSGREASIFGITDGDTVLSTVPACDYKRVFDGDAGPNTGGMGSYSPPEFLDVATLEKLSEVALTRAVRTMAAMGRPYRGVLYAGLMVDGNEAKVLEYNCRLGDPETQVILPRLKTDLLEVIEAVVTGTLGKIRLDWDERPCVGVVMASGGYPGKYETGRPIIGLDRMDPDVMVFHAGTKLLNGVPHTSGGRVLTVSALGKDMAHARERAYANVERIRFAGAHYRKDIALRASGV